ncbi:ABC transporter permease [Jiangella asiatica]|uniref:ABC transporter permease n=1 Tax=Jiangella asiatica TaxID=2530372 RepID=A0A4R5CSB8_9ACTN|nr:ABC transporter permease [Jiangella asiatica]TDE00563.1 ABC transporter permease [Jiangella asiatica]
MRRVIGIALGLSLMIGVLVTAFVWPNSEVAPRDVPIAVAGSPEAVGQVEEQLSAAMPDAFDVSQVDDEAAAREAIEDRDVYGAVLLDPAGPPQVLTASAAGPLVAQLLQGVAAELAAQSGGGEAPTAAVEDVVPLPQDDPRGAGFSSGALPMVLAGIAIGAAMSFVVPGVGRRLVGATVAALGGGTVAVLVMQTWLGVLDGNWLANAGAFALTLGATSIGLIGLNALLGHPGAGLGAAVVLLLGNPLSGVTSSPELLPSGWGALGQLLPPGAGGTLLRSTAYFDGAGSGQALLVLGSWVVGGLLLAALGARVRGDRANAASLHEAAGGVPGDPQRLVTP